MIHKFCLSKDLLGVMKKIAGKTTTSHTLPPTCGAPAAAKSRLQLSQSHVHLIRSSLPRRWTQLCVASLRSHPLTCLLARFVLYQYVQKRKTAIQKYGDTLHGRIETIRYSQYWFIVVPYQVTIFGTKMKEKNHLEFVVIKISSQDILKFNFCFETIHFIE